MPLNLVIEKATLVNVNLGNEGSGDGSISRYDLKLQFNATSEVLESFLVAKRKHKDMFWNKGVVFEGLGSIGITTEWRHNDLKFRQCDGLFEGDENILLAASNVTVKNASITPLSNHLLEVVLTAQVRDPDEHQMKAMADLQKKEVGLEIVFDSSVAQEQKEAEQEGLDLGD